MSDNKQMIRPGLSSLGTEDLEDFVRGAALLGAGGGGDPYVGRLILERELERGGRAEILDVDQLADDELVVSVCVMGAPTVMTEKVPSVAALEHALRQMEQKLGRHASALIPLEIGGINSTVPLVLGARLGLPIVNADGMGRAFPELQMVTFGIYGTSMSPLVVCNERGESAEITALSNIAGERLARSITSEMGGAAHVALYSMTGAETKDRAIRDTLSVALETGRAIRHARSNGLRPADALFSALSLLADPRSGRILFSGKVVDVQRSIRGGFSVGEVTIEGEGSPPNRVRVDFQNEFLIAYQEGKAIASTPDIIAILDEDTGEPITSDALKFGQRIQLIGISVPGLMRTSEALKVVGPRAFNIDMDYRPLEIGQHSPSPPAP